MAEQFLHQSQVVRLLVQQRREPVPGGVDRGLRAAAPQVRVRHRRRDRRIIRLPARVGQHMTRPGQPRRRQLGDHERRQFHDALLVALRRLGGDDDDRGRVMQAQVLHLQPGDLPDPHAAPPAQDQHEALRHHMGGAGQGVHQVRFGDRARETARQFRDGHREDRVLPDQLLGDRPPVERPDVGQVAGDGDVRAGQPGPPLVQHVRGGGEDGDGEGAGEPRDGVAAVADGVGAVAFEGEVLQVPPQDGVGGHGRSSSSRSATVPSSSCQPSSKPLLPTGPDRPI